MIPHRGDPLGAGPAATVCRPSPTSATLPTVTTQAVDAGRAGRAARPGRHPVDPAPATRVARRIALRPGGPRRDHPGRRPPRRRPAPARAAVPVALLIVALASRCGSASRRPGPDSPPTLISSEVIWGLLAAQGLFLVWRLLAVGSSLLDPTPAAAGTARRPPDRDPPAGHDRAAGLCGLRDRGRPRGGRRDLRRAIAGRRSCPRSSPSPIRASSRARRPARPRRRRRRPSAAAPRINGLIIGVDPGVGRNTYLTDTMIVVSLDPTTKTVSMVSIPRDMVDVPLADGRKLPRQDQRPRLVRAPPPEAVPGLRRDRVRRPDGRARHAARPQDQVLRDGQPRRLRQGRRHAGRRERQRRAGLLRPHYDDGYGFNNGFSITAGRHHLNGNQALAFARVRKASGESDFTRAARQQEVISGIREAIVTAAS